MERVRENKALKSVSGMLTACMRVTKYMNIIKLNI